jgi:hypothetical protein
LRATLPPNRSFCSAHNSPRTHALRGHAAPAAGPFLVYLSGVGDIPDEYQTSFEDELLAGVAARVPRLVVSSDVFAFSVRNLGMTSQRQFGWFWAWINQERLRKGSPLRQLGQLINLRNILHLTVSADARCRKTIVEAEVARMEQVIDRGRCVGRRLHQ